MGSAAGKLSVIAGRPIESPDVMYDMKERVHRTPHVRSSAQPSPTRLNINQEQDLMLLSNGTVVRLQTKQKDGTRGINLYKRSLKSVPRELFYHPLADEVTWLNLACNSLVYNKNGIFKGIDKVEKSYYKEDSDIEEEPSESRASSKRSSVLSKSPKQEEESEAPSRLSSADHCSTKSDKEFDQNIDEEKKPAVGLEDRNGTVNDKATDFIDDNAAEDNGIESTDERTKVDSTAAVAEASTTPENQNAYFDPPKTQSLQLARNVEDTSTNEESTNQEIPEELTARSEETTENFIETVTNVDATVVAPVLQNAEATTAEPAKDGAPESYPEDNVKEVAVTESVPVAAPAETGINGDTVQFQHLKIQPDDLIPEDVLSDMVSLDNDQKSVLDNTVQLHASDANSKPSDEQALKAESDEVVPDPVVIDNDTTIEDFDGPSTLRIRAPKSVAETVNISEFEESEESGEESIFGGEEAEQGPQDTRVSTPFPKAEGVKSVSSTSGGSSSSGSDAEEEEEEGSKEMMSDEEGDLHDDEGNVIPRPVNTLPNRFHKMPNLVELHLGYYGKGNPLKTIPSSVYNLQNLKKLDASSCRITELPNEICNLINLEELWLSGNFLSSLPKSLGNLKKLKSLWVNYNQLNGIPATLEFCESLEGLYAHGNQIEFLSTALCRIPQLQYLGVGRNRIKFLPKNIGKMKHLKEAWLNDNQIREIPESLFELESLKTLWLTSNQLTMLDKRVGKLSELSELSLSKNRLTTLPNSLANCTRLRVLQLDDNKLVALPKSLNNLAYLEELWLNGNAVKEMPEGLYMISNMRKPL